MRDLVVLTCKEMAVKAVVLFLLLFLPSNSTADCLPKSLQNVCEGKEGHNPFCEYKISQHCNKEPPPCHNTLHEEVSNEMCTITRFRKDDGCGSLQPSPITPPEASLVDLRMYHLIKWESEGLINMTFPALVNNTMKGLKFQYTFIGQKYDSSCRRLSLRVSPSSTLMYECHILKKFGNETVSVRLTVQSDSGEGASYLFRIPPGFRVDPQKTCPSDWHVFFYVHRDAIHHHKELPVSVQSSPFGQVQYEVMLAKCVGDDDDEEEDEDDEDCQEYEKLGSEVVQKNTSDDLWVVYLPRVEESGKYVVKVQMQADWCQPHGCYVSNSPKFLITKPPKTGTRVIFYLFLFLVVLIIIFIIQRRAINRQLFRHMSTCQSTVLLAYHPESLPALHFVNTLADFLERTCFMQPLTADREALGQDPIQWTKTGMTRADRVIFIVPKDSEGQSVTILRGLWMVALNHCSGHDFTTSQEKKVAKIMLPMSGSVPWQIADVRCFSLSHSPTSLATWLHGGSWLDRVFLWWPHIRSSAKKKITPTWQDVKLAASEDSQLDLTTTPQLTPLEKATSEMGQDLSGVSSYVKKSNQENDGSDDDDDEAAAKGVFDYDIPAVDKLCDKRLSSIHESLQEEEEEEEEEDVWDVMA